MAMIRCIGNRTVVIPNIQDDTLDRDTMYMSLNVIVFVFKETPRYARCRTVYLFLISILYLRQPTFSALGPCFGI